MGLAAMTGAAGGGAAAGGAMSPFALGAAGAGLKLGGSLVSSNEQKKQSERTEERPKRRRLKKFQESLQMNFDRNQAMLAALAQSHLDYAGMF